jgi:hypothetical protein
MADALTDATGCFGSAVPDTTIMQTFLGATSAISLKLDGTDGVSPRHLQFALILCGSFL